MNNNIHQYRKDMVALIDWLEFTLPRPSELSSELLDDQLFYVFDLLQIPQTNFKSCKTGMNGYKKRVRFNNITVLYDGSDTMGIHIIMTGQGCRLYEQYMFARMEAGEIDPQSVGQIWQDLFSRIDEYSDRYTRLDLSVDDFKTHFTLSDMVNKLNLGLCSSLFNDFKVISSGKISTGHSKGLTIYLGSATSDFQIVVYDKYLERISKSKDVDDDIQAWNRFECRYYDKHALMAVRRLLEGEEVGKLVHGTIHRYFNILQPKKGDSNRSRWDYWRSWARFLGGVEKVKFDLRKPDKTIEETIKYFIEKLPRVLAKAHAFGGDELINNTIADGIGKLTETDLDMLGQAVAAAQEYEDEDEQLSTEFKRQYLSKKRVITTEHDDQ